MQLPRVTVDFKSIVWSWLIVHRSLIRRFPVRVLWNFELQFPTKTQWSVRLLCNRTICGKLWKNFSILLTVASCTATLLICSIFLTLPECSKAALNSKASMKSFMYAKSIWFTVCRIHCSLLLLFTSLTSSSDPLAHLLCAEFSMSQNYPRTFILF